MVLLLGQQLKQARCWGTQGRIGDVDESKQNGSKHVSDVWMQSSSASP